MKCQYCNKNFENTLSFKNLFTNYNNFCPNCRKHISINVVAGEHKRFYFFDYEFVKDDIYNIKYFGNAQYCLKFKILFQNFFKQYSFDLITTVPSNKTREIIRGYNHIDLICELCNIKITKLLTCDYRQKQAKLHKKRTSHKFQLLENDINIDEIEKILIIDDIYTSGNTLNSCASALKQQFQKSEIFFLTIANSN